MRNFFKMFFNQKPSFKFAVSNNDTDYLIVWIEPWAHDFTLEPGEDIQIICDSAEADMDIHRKNGLMQIYLNSSCSFIVQQQGKTINCGHKRKPDL
ncbi:hypothetical protein ACO0LD_26540 [Undibacterium sp. Ji83W]|uniref:hypothetical protein n=1 Tax=Undibacterium sp. Ji83W TaxID=3413043 RepID=UPI003BF1B45A